MTPTSLPAMAIAPAATAQPAAPAAGQIAPADFLLMLGQLAGVPVPQVAAASTNVATPSKEGDDALTTEEVAVDLLAMFPLSLPVTTPNVSLLANQQGSDKAALDIASLVSRGSSATDATQSQLLSDLMRVDQELSLEPASDFGSVQLSAPSQTQQAARVTGHEAAFSRPVQQPVGSSAWADEIGSRLTLMAEQGRHTASLRLSPEHLGPLEIRIAVRDDQASVWFGAAHADTRAAIETALPRLRELFASQGLSLADAGVFREPPREHAKPAHAGAINGDSQSSDENVVVIRRTSLGLIDAYA